MSGQMQGPGFKKTGKQTRIADKTAGFKRSTMIKFQTASIDGFGKHHRRRESEEALLKSLSLAPFGL